MLFYMFVLQANPSLKGVRCRYELFVMTLEKQTTDYEGTIRLMLGFFVTQIFRRWYDQFQNIANANYISLMLLGFVSHKDDPEGRREEARLYTRSIVRSGLPDGCSQIFRLYAFGPSGLRDYAYATLRCKI